MTNIIPQTNYNRICGIYKITNAITGEFYIGSTADLSRRFRDHQSRLIKNMHPNPHLQNSWNKHGDQSFEYSVLEFCDLAILIEREQFYIDKERPSYNILQIAGSPLGYKHTDEARAKISAAQTGELHHLFGKHPSDEAKRKNSEAHIGKALTDEARAKMSEAHKGMIFTKEHKRNLSTAATRREAARREPRLEGAT